MSFFGFDASGAQGPQRARGGRQQHQQRQQHSQQHSQQPLDFDDTYKGYGEYAPEEEDFLNDETFGNDVEVGNNFDFGHGAAASAPAASAAPGASAGASAAPPQQHRSYVAAAAGGVHPAAPVDSAADLKPMESLWNPAAAQAAPPAQPQGRVLSLEEVERQQRQMQQMPPQQMPPQQMPPQGYAMVPQGYAIPPQGYAIPPQGYAMPPQGYAMPPQGYALPPQGYAMPPQGYAMPPQGYAMQQMPQQPMQQMPQQPAVPQAPVAQQPVAQAPVAQQPAAQPQLDRSASSLSQNSQSGTPGPAPMGEAELAAPVHQQMQQQQQQQMQQGRQRQRNREPLTPEEQKRLDIRHAKVEKILKHSGLMTPRDKDFITRYQLSQIVTEDPYNEDFYFQVYKIIQRGGVVGESNKGLIARAYLEHSGHRLGGRYKRADIALQRMQSQVEKAVTVAKERPLRKQEKELAQQQQEQEGEAASGAAADSRDGVLGRISSSLNSKAPRRQLQIPAANKDALLNSLLVNDEHHARSSAAAPDALMEVTESLGNVDLSQKSRVRRRSSYAFSSVDQSSVMSRSGGRKFVLSLIETVYEEVLELEANLRSGKATDVQKLWEALHINDELYEVCPFISMLSFDKGIKIMPRIFNFLEKEQKLQLLQTFFSELSHLNIIIISSYKTNPQPSEAQLKQIDVFQTVFLKIIVSFLSSSSNFIEIMGLLLHLIKNNSVSFISTSKIGLNLITVLISRAALIRQDTNRSNMLSSPEISTWNEIYDKLFTALESKIAAVFPPREYIAKVTEKSAGSAAAPQHYDQAYIWQFLASLALSGKLNHQRIIIDEVRDQIFGTLAEAGQLATAAAGPGPDAADSRYRRDKLYQDLNLFLNVMGLVARDGEISELK